MSARPGDLVAPGRSQVHVDLPVRRTELAKAASRSPRTTSRRRRAEGRDLLLEESLAPHARRPRAVERAQRLVVERRRVGARGAAAASRGATVTDAEGTERDDDGRHLAPVLEPTRARLGRAPRRDPPPRPRDAHEAVDDGGHQEPRERAAAVARSIDLPQRNSILETPREEPLPAHVLRQPPENRLAVLLSEPLVLRHRERDVPVPTLDFAREKALLKKSVRDAALETGREIELRVEPATADSLRSMVTLGCAALHFAGHGHPDFLCFEDGRGGAHALDAAALRALVGAGGGARDDAVRAEARLRQLVLLAHAAARSSTRACRTS